MFRKVLIAEDQDTTHRGVESILKETITHVSKTKYCDDAVIKVKASLQEGMPFELLITDLQFEEDHRDRSISIGEDLITEVKQLIPNIKIIVFSVEKGIGRIKRLYDDYGIHAFVAKGRDESLHIKRAIQAVYNKEPYCTPKIKQLLRNVDDIDEINDADIKILNFLSRGLSQKQISETLIPPCSLSSIEKNISRLKVLLNAKNPVQLISLAKDRGII
ncbi:response regulator [uncultured Dokdonia sp.]|uniref:response regulator n=1 Tax=uncultured Dokdonia sp. TaxID=575653 RepID=UPI002612CE6A|nr:response regulator [uncultured Dokdonia sp.]